MTRKTPFVVAFCDNVVDCYSDNNVMYPGGNCLNVAVFAHRAGADAAYAGAVADDAAGRAIRDALVAEGVDVSRLRFLPGQTAYCVIALRDGERVFAGANLGVSIVAPAQEDLELAARADALHTGRSSHSDAWLATFARSMLISYDFATLRDRARIDAVAPYCFLASFSGGDISEEEAIGLADLTRTAGAEWVLVTRGSAGALLAGPDGIFETPAVEVAPVDTLGAGDTFIAYTLVGLLRREVPETILAAAANAAAETCLVRGAFGHGRPMEVDISTALTIEEIYRTTRPAPGPAEV